MYRGHDLGGMIGLGPVEREDDEPVFHADWERAVFTALQAARGGGLMNSHQFRDGIERMHPALYLLSSYYEHFVHTLEHNLVHRGVTSVEELAELTRRYLADRDTSPPQRSDPELGRRTARRIAEGRPGAVAVETPPSFAVGQTVVTRNFRTAGHTRLPGYLRARRGIIERVHAAYELPDKAVKGSPAQAEYVYTVGFDASQVWGEGAEPNLTLHADLWESYLEPRPAVCDVQPAPVAGEDMAP